MNLPPKLKLKDEVILIAPARKVELGSLIMAENLLLKWGTKTNTASPLQNESK